MKVINLDQKFAQFDDRWSPKIIASLNGQDVKLAKLEGEFVMHNHEDEDELFFVVKGSLKLVFNDREEIINAGEMIVVPKGVDHKPIAEEETWVMLFEPAEIKHTGKVKTDMTVEQCERI